MNKPVLHYFYLGSNNKGDSSAIYCKFNLTQSQEIVFQVLFLKKLRQFLTVSLTKPILNFTENKPLCVTKLFLNVTKLQQSLCCRTINNMVYVDFIPLLNITFTSAHKKKVNFDIICFSGAMTLALTVQTCVVRSVHLSKWLIQGPLKHLWSVVSSALTDVQWLLWRK